MNKTTASLSKGFLSVFLMLSLVLPSIAIPLEALALEGAAGGEADGSQYGGGGGEGTGTGQGEPDSDGDGASDSAEADASAAAAESVASAASVAGVEVGVATVDTTKDANAVAGMVSVDGVTMSVDAAMAAIGAIADAQAQGLNPSTNSSVPGIDVGATLSANAMGELGSVVGSMTAETGDAKSVAAAETGAAIGQQAGLQALGLAAGINGMNPASAPAANANAALAAAAAHPAMLSPVSLVSSLPVGFTFAPLSTVNISAKSMTGLAAPTATFSTKNDPVDATAFSFADDFSLDDTDDANFVDDPASLDQYSQYALGMEIGRMATQKSIAESRYSQMAAQAAQPFAPTTQAQAAAMTATKAEIDAWAATIDARVNPTTQNQAVAVISQDKSTALGKMAADMATAVSANDTSKANQLSQAISVAIASYDDQIADAKSSAVAAQKSLTDANVAARSAVNAALGNVVSVEPLGTLSEPDSISSVTDLGTAVTDAFVAIGLDPATAVTAQDVAAVVADIASFGVLGIAANLADSYEYSSAAAETADPDSKAALSAQADQSFAQAATGVATAVAGIGIANGFVGAVSAGIGKSAAFGIGNAASKSTTAAAPAAASTAGKTAAGTTGKTVSVSYNPTTNTVTVHAPVTTSAVVEGRIASTAAKSVDDIATPAASVAKSADDVATTPTAVAKAADDVAAPANATAGKAPTGNNPANPNATGYQTASTPAANAAKSADNVAAPASNNANTPASASSLGSRSATTPTSASSPASKSVSAVMAVVEALSAPVSVSPATLSKSFVGIADDVASVISRTADDITPTTPTTLSLKSVDDIAVPTVTKTADNIAVPATVPTSQNTVTTNQSTQVTVANTVPSQPTAAKATVDNVSVPFSPLSPLSQAQVQSIANSITDATTPTVLGTIAVDMSDLGRTSTYGTPQTATLSSNPVTGMVDVTLDNHPLAQVNSITPAQAQSALASSKATPMPNDFLTQSIAAIADFVAPPTQVIGTFTLDVPSQTTAPTSVTVSTVTPNEVATAQQQAQSAAQTTPATTQTSPTQTAATPASNQTAPTAAQTTPTAPAATQPTTANPTFAPTDLGKYTVTPSTQATPATEVALGLKSLGEPTSKMQTDAATAGFNIESPQQAVAIGIAHEVSPQTRDAIVDAYTRDGNFDSLPDSIIAEPAAFINAIANEAAGKNRSVAQQIAFANYLSSVTVDKKAYDTMANPQTRAAMTELAKQLTNGTIAAKRGLDVAAPAKTANHFYASYITPSWAKTLTDVVKVGDFTKTITGLSSKETNPTKQGTKSVLERIDQAALFSPDSLADMPAPTQTLVVFADKLSKSTPASLALEIQAAGLSRIADALPQTKAPAAEPAVATPSAPTATNPSAQTQTPAQTAAGQDSIITKDSTDAQVQDFWAKRQPSKAHANIDEVNPRLLKAEAMGVQAFEAKNPTLKVTIQGPSSGVRTSGSVANHGKQADGHGGALDVVIYDTVTGARYSNHSYAKYRGSISPGKASPVYQQLFNDTVIAAYHIDPVLAKSLRFGGYFLDSNPLDLMHTDVLSHKPHAGGKTLSGFTDVQMKRYGITDNYPLKSWDNVKTLADDRYNNPNQSVTPTVATPVQTAPEVTTAVPTSRPDAIPATVSPSAPISPTPAQVVAPSVPTPSTVSGSPTTNTNTATPNNTTGYPSTPGQGDTTVSPTTNAGVPPDFQSTGGTGPVAGGGTGLVNSVLSPVYAFFAAIAVGINALLGADKDDDAEEDTATPTPSASSVTFNPNGIDGGVPGSNNGSDVSGGEPAGDNTGTETTADQVDTPTSPATRANSNLDSNTYMDKGASSTKTTINVLIQVDGNTGDLYFDIAGEYEDGIYYDMSEADEDAEEDKSYDVETSRIVLDDQRLNILYSDGTYAPVVIDGVWYESADDPNYVYTVEYYLDGELVAAADNAGVLPEGNPLTNLLGNLFSSSDEYGLEDVDTITRALIDPDEQVPADEYYIYRVYLNGGGTRSTTVPRYTSYRFMSERFAETGFTGNVTALIAESIEVPPPSRGGVSAIVDTFKKIGLSVVDLFQDDEAENPVVTDFGNLTPSDDGEITMGDIRSVTVLLDVEAECPFVPGLSRPYLYEIVIAQAAISGATTDQAFRAVRCGGGDKADFVEQIAAHFETFDGVGIIDRQAMSEMIRFALFKDLDLSFLLEDDGVETPAATSTPATVPDGEDQEYVPNLTNDVVFEVKAVGSQGQTLLDWSVANEIRIGSTVQLYFRWDGSDYEQCLPFLNDNGVYALKASGGKMTTGNTESEGYDVPEANTTYRIECGGQRNNEFGVDDRSIKVIIE